MLNQYKPSVLFVGQRQTVQTQTGHYRMRRLIRVSTVCLPLYLLYLNLNNDEKYQPTALKTEIFLQTKQQHEV